MLPEEYIDHLEKIKNDKFLLNKTLNSNYRTFNFEMKDMDDLK